MMMHSYAKTWIDGWRRNKKKSGLGGRSYGEVTTRFRAVVDIRVLISD